MAHRRLERNTPRQICRLTILAIPLFLCVARPARGDSVNLGAVADNTLYAEDGNQSNGAGNGFFAGRTNNSEIRRGLIRFDVTGIPAGSTINSVTLTLYCSRTRTNAQSVRLHRLNASWGEGTSHAPGEEGSGTAATTGDATWTYRFYNTQFWTTPGGDFAGTASATTTVNNQNQYYTWTSAGMVSDVQAWLNSPASNNGWIVIGNETTDRVTKRFESRQSTTPSYRPSLAITYTPPLLTGACCLPGGNCSVLTPAECAAQSGSYQGDSTTCTPNPCQQPTGACCLADGTCTVLTSAACASQDGAYQGDGTTCSPNPCPQPTGACCFTSGTCQVLTSAACASQGGTYQGNDVPCAGDLCPIILTPYVDPMPIPPLATPSIGQPGGAATYDMHIVQVQKQLHRDLPPTTLWTYEGMFPGPTILATREVPVTVNWINDLKNTDGSWRTTHFLPVNLCPHGASNEPRIVTHLHGGHVAMDSDGYPEWSYLPGNSATYLYPNHQLPALIWYHDHALGVARLNVYMGMAGGYLITDAFEQSLDLPSGEHHIPLVIQDRNFNPDGSLKYPAVLQEHVFGDKMLVNGKIWPYLNVKQGKYRFRALNGCNSRTLTLGLSNGQSFQQIGTDGGMLPAPVTMTQLTLGPGERADLIFDFAMHPAGAEILLLNTAAAPYPVGDPMHDLPNIMKFVVTGQSGYTNPVPAVLRPISTLNPSDAVVSRDFILRKMSDPCAGSMWMINDLHYDDITEFPVLGTSEMWKFVNRSGVSHPMHMHLVMFQLVDRQNFDVVNDEIVPVGDPIPPPPNEAGWKDTIMCGPGQITRVIARFENYVGKYAYHCHILEHEEHEMMRQFQTRCIKGDTNQDTLVNGLDIERFIAAITAGASSGTAEFCASDMNDNGSLEHEFDVPLFVDCLLGLSCP